MISLIFWQAFPKAHVPFELYRNKWDFFSTRRYIKAKICRNLLIFLKIFKKIKSESFFCNQLQKMFTLRKTALTYTVRNMYENFWLFSQSSRIQLFPNHLEITRKEVLVAEMKVDAGMETRNQSVERPLLQTKT